VIQAILLFGRASAQGDQHAAVLDPHRVGAHGVLGGFQADAVAEVEMVLVERRGDDDVLARLPTRPRDSTLAPDFGSTLSMA
jgi:hypothetical protein